ncbi:MAG: YtxH domain-containing protein [Planctomycetota bacterium]
MSIDVKHLTKDDLLQRFGLQRRPSAVDYLLPVAGVFGAGLLVGAGLALLFAPKSGRELRDDLRHRLPGGEPEEARPEEQLVASGSSSRGE